MAHKVTVNQVPLNLGLANVAEITVAGTVITLTDDQFSQINPLAFTDGWLTDGGYIGVGAVTVQASKVTLTSAQDAALTSSQNATAAANTQTGSYVQADVQTIATLANALKASYNQAQADLAALRTQYNALQTDVAAIITSLTAAGAAMKAS